MSIGEIFNKKKPLENNIIFYITWIYNLYKPYKIIIFVLILMTIISTIVSVSLPLVVRNILDKIISCLNKIDRDKLNSANVLHEIRNSMILLFLVGCGFYFNGLYTSLRMIMNLRFEKFLKLEFFQEVINKSYEFYLKFRTGDLVTRLTEDIKTWPPGLSWVACSGIFRAVNSSNIVFFCLVSMYFINKYLTFIIAVTLPIIVYTFLKFEKAISEKFKTRQETLSETNDILESTFSGIKVIKIFNAENAIYNIYQNQLAKRINCELEKNKIEVIYNIIMDWLNNISIIAVMSLGSLFVIKEIITLGDLYAFFSYLGMITYPLIDVPVLLYTFSQACISIDRLEELKENKDKNRTSSTSYRITVSNSCSIETRNTSIQSLMDKAIVVRNVNFSYITNDGTNYEARMIQNDTERFYIKDLSFEINKFEKVAIVGTIGSGKTTLLKLIAGILKPTCGEIIVNGVVTNSEIINTQCCCGRCNRCIIQSQIMSKIAYIPQEAVIFSTSILNNIDLWRKIDIKIIEESAKLAQIHEDISILPNKYLERLGIKGIKLSGGQKQRIEIARALAGSPNILLMDDVTSALDAENEVKLWNAIEKHFPHSTCLVVTHRLKTVEICDKVLVLNNGKLENIGSLSEILPVSPTLQKMIKS